MPKRLHAAALEWGAITRSTKFNSPGQGPPVERVDQHPQLKNRTQHFLLNPPIDSSLF